MIFHIPLENPDVERALELIWRILTHSFKPIRLIYFETINDEAARVIMYSWKCLAFVFVFTATTSG
ncbi:MAG TPA: hypothetical protein DCS60_01555 [Opitutae bacterium]|nr:hypothetical protein [Opitutae bacterium]